MVVQELHDIMALGNKSMPESVFPVDGTPPPEQGRQGKKRGPKGKPKGRMVIPEARATIAALLGTIPLRRDQLIEYLHIIQDEYGHLSAAHLAGLADLMKLPMAEVWEVASFYDHFDLVSEGMEAPPARTIRICTSLSCMMQGGEALLQKMQSMRSEGKIDADVRFVPAPCLGACDVAPAAADGHNLVGYANTDNLMRVITTGTPHDIPDYIGFTAYRAAAGYALIEALNAATDDAHAEMVSGLMSTLSDAALRGLGGAGFPTGRKWSIVAGYDGPRLMAVNGDEGEPGTFKDRYYLSSDPHRMLEGVLLASHMVGITKCYLYIRDEYPEIIALLTKELALLEASGLLGSLEIELRRGAGAYICGEESAMIESIEGKRGLPRHRPPYVAERGLFDRPTLVNNVETLFWVRDILERGADWYNDQGREGHPGFRTYSVSGRVAQPGLVTTGAGATVAELIEACGGMADGHEFKGYLPGGASGGILPAHLADVPLDFGGKLAELGCFVGSHAIVVLSDKDNMWKAATNLLQFFAHESCGQCTPCRSGTEKAISLMTSDAPDTALLGELADIMADASICGLGQAASNPLISAMTHFPGDIPDAASET